MRVKVFGLKRSGTNLVEFLLERNYVNVTLSRNAESGWKHTFNRVQWLYGSQLPSVFVVKDVFAWLVSVWKWENKTAKQSVYGYNEAGKGALFTDFVHRGHQPELWATMNDHWLHTCNALVKYEDLLKEPEKAVENVADWLACDSGQRLEKKDEPFIVPVGRMGTTSNELKDSAFDPTWYTEKRYMSRYNGWLIREVRQRTWSTLKRLGYANNPYAGIQRAAISA